MLFVVVISLIVILILLIFSIVNYNKHFVKKYLKHKQTQNRFKLIGSFDKFWSMSVFWLMFSILWHFFLLS